MNPGQCWSVQCFVNQSHDFHPRRSHSLHPHLTTKDIPLLYRSKHTHQRCWTGKVVAHVQKKSFPFRGGGGHECVKGRPHRRTRLGFDHKVFSKMPPWRDTPQAPPPCWKRLWLHNAFGVLCDLVPLQSHAIHSPLPLCDLQPFWISSCCFHTPSLVPPQGLCTGCGFHLECSCLCFISFCPQVSL